MRNYGNITIKNASSGERDVGDARLPPPRVPTPAPIVGVQAQTMECPKCGFACWANDTVCGRCGVIFAKLRSEQWKPQRPRYESVAAPLQLGDAIVDGERTDTDYVSELRVMSIGASLLTIAVGFAALAQKSVGGRGDIFAVLVGVHLLAFFVWVGARAYEWGVKNGLLGIVVLFFVTGWVWPLLSKPLSWIAGAIGRALPRATSVWTVGAALLVAAGVALSRS